jgi:hypothetical protein
MKSTVHMAACPAGSANKHPGVFQDKIFDSSGYVKFISTTKGSGQQILPSAAESSRFQSGVQIPSV